MDLLTVFTVTWNEEKNISDFIDWYRTAVPECKIVIYDNYSTDKTVEIALSKNCEVKSFDTNGKLDEMTLINIRNNCWKEYNSHYYCVVDADEFVEVTKEFLLKGLNENWDICKCFGYEMFGDNDDTIWDLKYGVPSVGYSKPVLFKNTIAETNFEPGSHKGNPIKKFNLPVNWINDYPNLYHTKWRSWENGIQRQKQIAERGRSGHSISMGWAYHYELPEQAHIEHFTQGYKNRIKIR